jgi:putative endonuclease
MAAAATSQARHDGAMAFLYILKCADGSLYVGSTTSLRHRLYQHQTGVGATYTARRLPVELVYVEEHEHVGAAFAREKQIQNWSQAKRLALIEQRWDDLHELARRRVKPRRTDLSPGLDTASPGGSAGSTTETCRMCSRRGEHGLRATCGP